jgi:mitochondrial fission protein ELM1
MLACADRVVCTPDSVNMLSEACATAAPVYVLEPAVADGRVGAFLRALESRGRLRAAEGELAPFAAVPLRETARVAVQVRERLGL